MITKICKSCLTDLPLDSYHIQAKGKHGKTSKCKTCRSVEGSGRYLERHRNNNLKKFYGITEGDYQEMFDAQNGVCAICELPETATRMGKTLHLAVDHDHKSGRVRSLLCAHCNQAIGKFRDNPDLLMRAAEYLRSHQHPVDRKNLNG